MYFIAWLCRLVETVLYRGWHRVWHSAQISLVDWNWQLKGGGHQWPGSAPDPSRAPQASGLRALLPLVALIPEILWIQSEHGSEGTWLLPTGRVWQRVQAHSPVLKNLILNNIQFKKSVMIKRKRQIKSVSSFVVVVHLPIWSVLLHKLNFSSWFATWKHGHHLLYYFRENMFCEV